MKKGKIFLLALILVFIQGFYFSTVSAEIPKKEVAINQLNYVLTDKSYETLTYTTQASGRLDIIVPLEYVSQNGQWEVYLKEKDKPYGHQFRGAFKTYDVLKDVVILRAYVVPGTYEVVFSGKNAICQINFVVDIINDEIEPNDQANMSNPLFLNVEKRAHLGRETIQDDVDWFHFVVDEGGMGQVLVSHKEYYGDFNFTLYKEDINGNLVSIYENQNLDSKEVNTPSDYLMSEKYILKKTSKMWFNTGKYYVKMERIGSGCYYTLKVDFESMSAPNREKEDNNTHIKATEMPINQDYIGNLESLKDIDWYHIKLNDWKLVQVLLKTVRQNHDKVYIVDIYKVENGELKNIGSIWSEQNNILHASNKILLPKGDYYIKIKTEVSSYTISDVELSSQDYNIQFKATPFNKLPKPTFTIKKTNFYGERAIYVKPKSFKYADEVEIYVKKGQGKWKKECSLDVNLYDGRYIDKITNGKKYYIKVRSKKKVGNRFIYSDWSNIKSTVFYR